MANNVFQVRALLAAGVSPDCRVWNWQSALICSIRLSKTECLRALLEAGASAAPAPPNWDPLTTAVERGLLAMVELLLRYGAWIDFQPDDASELTAFETAVLTCRADLVARLCAAGANPNHAIPRCFGFGAWPRILSRGYTSIQVLRLARDGQTPTRRTSAKVASRLIVRVPVLLAAIACGAPEVAEALLTAGADPHATDSDGRGIDDYKRRYKNPPRNVWPAGS
jgi:ankyrin repeat protein